MQPGGWLAVARARSWLPCLSTATATHSSRRHVSHADGTQPQNAMLLPKVLAQAGGGCVPKLDIHQPAGITFPRGQRGTWGSPK